MAPGPPDDLQIAESPVRSIPNFLRLHPLLLLSCFWLLFMLRPRPHGAIRLFGWINRPIVTRHCTNLQFSSLPPRSSAQRESSDHVPLRKQLKQDAKALRAEKRQRKESEEASRQIWELTVGVEIHAQLDTAAKLFSREYPVLPTLLVCSNESFLLSTAGAATSTSDLPNSNVALFDLAFPGSQPVRVNVPLLDRKDTSSCDTGISSCHSPPRPPRRNRSELRHSARQSV